MSYKYLPQLCSWILVVLPYNCFYYYLYIFNYAHLFKNWNTSSIFIKCTELLKRHWGLLKRQILEPYHNWIGFCCSFILLFLTFYFVLSLFPLPYCFSCAVSYSEQFKLCFFCQWEDSYCFNSEWSHHMVSDVSPKS